MNIYIIRQIDPAWEINYLACQLTNSSYGRLTLHLLPKPSFQPCWNLPLDFSPSSSSPLSLSLLPPFLPSSSLRRLQTDVLSHHLQRNLVYLESQVRGFFSSPSSPSCSSNQLQSITLFPTFLCTPLPLQLTPLVGVHHSIYRLIIKFFTINI